MNVTITLDMIATDVDLIAIMSTYTLRRASG